MAETISTRHKEFDAWVSRWLTIDHAIEGEHIVKSMMGAYLRPLSGMSATANDVESYLAYKTYLERARWYAAPGRALAAMLGLVARRPVTVNADSTLMDIIQNDVDGRGVGISQMALRLVAGVLCTSRPLLVVDYTNGQDTPLGKGRAFINVIQAENVINWRDESGEPQLVVIETLEEVVDPGDEFRTNNVRVYRVYRLEEGGVTYQRYNEIPNTGIVPEEKQQLTIMNKPMEKIPAKFITITEDQFVIETPPIEPICDNAFHYYRVSADRNWGLHHIALPSIVYTGVNNTRDIPSGWGPSVAIGLPAGATAEIISYTGDGLGELTIELDSIKAEIADYGARLIESRARVGEAQATVETKMMSDSASLSMIANACARGLTWALKLFHELSGRPSKEVLASIDTDFVTLKLSGAELSALVKAYLDGGMPMEVFFNNLKEGGVVDQDMEFEAFKDQLDEENKNRMALTEPTIGGNGQDGPPVNAPHNVKKTPEKDGKQSSI